MAGVGTVLLLLFNGLFIGAAAGYVNGFCNPESFWTFVVGHSSFELVGMVIAGVAGMRMGMGILQPGRLPRTRALMESARRALPLLLGAALMTALAAVIEGFWSAKDFPPMVKYVFGGFWWVVHVGYFLLAGRGVDREVGV